MVTSGPRTGLFIDATLFRSWKDFDNPIKPTEDGADNNLHTVPFGDFQNVFKARFINNLSIWDTSSLTSKYMCLITVEVTDQTQAVKLLQQLKLEYQSRLKLKTFMVFQNVEGGSLSQLIVMIGAHSMEEYGKTERLMEDINAIEAQLKTKIVNSITSEKLLYREDMSLFAKEP